MQVHMQRSKPPSEENLERAVLGIGLQGIQISEGLVNMNAISDTGPYPRTFIGVDPSKQILYLLAFEKASPFLMLTRAREEGVIYGGQVDSGDGTSLIIGPGARGVRAHIGIRHRRPLGPYLKIYAERSD
jgi:hypothetical protein